MPGKAAKITITERQQEILQSLRTSVTVPSRLRQRASIIGLAFDGLRNEAIADQVGLTRRQVGRWRRRWAPGLGSAHRDRVPPAPRRPAAGHRTNRFNNRAR